MLLKNHSLNFWLVQDILFKENGSKISLTRELYPDSLKSLSKTVYLKSSLSKNVHVIHFLHFFSYQHLIRPWKRIDWGSRLLCFHFHYFIIHFIMHIHTKEYKNKMVYTYKESKTKSLSIKTTVTDLCVSARGKPLAYAFFSLTLFLLQCHSSGLRCSNFSLQILFLHCDPTACILSFPSLLEA